MLAMPGLRVFSLSPSRDSEGVSCDANGMFIGGVPLLKSAYARTTDWIVRPVAEINDELSARYRLPIDVSAKAGALALIANALNRGDLAMVAIVTVQMQFPDPPALAKGAESTDELVRRAFELHRSHLPKADPDWEAQHPRIGTPPNPGWFAPVPKEVKPPEVTSTRTGWPLPHVNKLAREFASDILRFVVRNAGRLVLTAVELDPVVDVFIAVFTPVELNNGEDRLTAQLKSALDPPKTLEELQQKPTENILGYEQHHIVEQNPSNIQKDITFDKFGSARINDPSNVVWAPHFPHLEISADYSSVEKEGRPTLREELKEKSFEEQRQEGLKELRQHGVLK
jgi:hypothetical protein